MIDNPRRILGAAVVGLGVGELHAEKYASLSNCELCLVYDLDNNKGKSVAEKFRCENAKEFEQILNDPRIDIISIASFDDAHCKQILDSLSAGKHLFVEKPLCNTFTELKAIKSAWNNYKDSLKIGSNLILRTALIYKWVKKAIRAGELGEIYAFDGDYLSGRMWKITHGWRGKTKDYSVMKGGGIHLIDLMVWLTGQQPKSVMTYGNGICTRSSEFSGNDFMASTFKFDSGLVGRITANLGCVHRHQHVIRIFGTKATFICDDAGPRIHRTRDPEENFEPIPLETLPRDKGDLIPNFVKSIIENIDLTSDTQEIFDLISMCTACDEALAMNSEVEIPYI